jgi:hypothetical protein
VEHVAALALQAADADPKALTLLLHRGQQPALVEALLQGRLADSQRLVDGLAEALARRERRLRLQVLPAGLFAHEMAALDDDDSAALGVDAGETEAPA